MKIINASFSGNLSHGLIELAVFLVSLICKNKLQSDFTNSKMIYSPLPLFSVSKLLAGSLIEINRGLKSMKDN